MRIPNITLIQVEHPHAKRDVPKPLRVWEEHAAVLGLVIIMLGSYCGPSYAYAAFAALLCVAGGFRYWKRTLVHPRVVKPQSPVADTEQPDARSRLVCYGAPCELAELREVRDVQFQPFITRQRESLKRVPWKAPASHALSVGDVLALACAGVMYVLGLPWWSIVGVVVLAIVLPWVIDRPYTSITVSRRRDWTINGTPHGRQRPGHWMRFRWTLQRSLAGTTNRSCSSAALTSPPTPLLSTCPAFKARMRL